jgi:hypothetical protein
MGTFGSHLSIELGRNDNQTNIEVFVKSFPLLMRGTEGPELIEAPKEPRILIYLLTTIFYNWMEPKVPSIQ